MNKEQTLKTLADLGKGRDKFLIISDWVIELRSEYEKTVGYPYLESVKDWIVKKEKLTVSETESKNLTTLIYNAANVTRKRQDIAAGFTPVTTERIKELLGKKCEYRADGLFGSSMILGKIIDTGNGRYAFLPKGRRTRGMWIHEDSKIREAA